jgi:DNA-binding MarR family transcriptional regulator
MSIDQSAIDLQQLDELRQQHIGRLLLRAQRAFSVRAIKKLRVRGHEGLSLAHTALLANLDLQGTRITTLAERVGVTKQAIGHLVQDLEQKGYIARAADSSCATRIRSSARSRPNIALRSARRGCERCAHC